MVLSLPYLPIAAGEFSLCVPLGGHNLDSLTGWSHKHEQLGPSVLQNCPRREEQMNVKWAQSCRCCARELGNMVAAASAAPAQALGHPLLSKSP